MGECSLLSGLGGYGLGRGDCIEGFRGVLRFGAHAPNDGTPGRSEEQCCLGFRPSVRGPKSYIEGQQTIILVVCSSFVEYSRPLF